MWLHFMCSSYVKNENLKKNYNVDSIIKNELRNQMY